MSVPRPVGRGHGTVMLGETVSFVVAAVLHLDVGLRIRFGSFAVRGEHAPGSAIIELIIAVVLLLAVLAVVRGSVHARLLAALATGAAVLGVIAELATIAVGVGPRTIPDLAYQIAIMMVLLISFGVLMIRRPRA